MTHITEPSLVVVAASPRDAARVAHRPDPFHDDDDDDDERPIGDPDEDDVGDDEDDEDDDDEEPMQLRSLGARLAGSFTGAARLLRCRVCNVTRQVSLRA